jgi:hypothetical protein
MLSELQQRRVWEDWLTAEMRANYFADISYRYQASQRWLNIYILILTSGAFATLITDWVPPRLIWLKSLLALMAAILSFVSLIQRNEESAVRCSDLHFLWNRLAGEYEALWNDMYCEDAATRFSMLGEKNAELSKTGLAIRYRERLMSKWQARVESHHAQSAA